MSDAGGQRYRGRGSLFVHSEPAGGTPARSWPAINNSQPGQAIYHSFLGSGTSLIAPEMSGRVCYGLELNPLYVNVIARGWQVFTGRAAMHQACGQSFDERADRQDHDQSGAARGAKTIRRD
jgi:hypothetical protein